MENGEVGLRGESVTGPVMVESESVIGFAERKLMVAENVLAKGFRRKSATLLNAQVTI